MLKVLSLLIILISLSLSSSWKISNNIKRNIASLSLGLGLVFSHSNEALAAMQQAPWDNQVSYEVIKSNPNGLQPKVGELVAIRFKGSYKGTEFDNTFKTAEPYFYRAGVGLIVKGLDDAIPQMHVGEIYKLSFKGDRSFEKGKPSSPGKPRIIPGAEIEYEVELTELPGAAEEFILDVE